ncbi:MAG: site-specific DNA-methyltransferase [Lentisphaerae bacterium]|nr:site-specific DNA-methyltransferase [Lentisphaerota bacterium]
MSVSRVLKQAEGEATEVRLGALYERAMQATRGGPLFNASPYPTKISPEAIALFIAAHTVPGATVLDGFGGSGSTGLAAIREAPDGRIWILRAAQLLLHDPAQPANAIPSAWSGWRAVPVMDRFVAGAFGRVWS